MADDDKKKITEYVVNADTGEILNEIYEGDRFTLRRESQDKFCRDYVKFNDGETFVKVYDNIVPLMEKYLTSPEVKFVFCLFPHICYDDCVLRINHDKHSQILTIKNISTIHGYKYDYAKKLMSSLKKKGVVGKHETGSIIPGYKGRYGTVYTVNPFLFFRGSYLSHPVYSFYEKSGWRELLLKSGEVQDENEKIL